MIDNQFNLQNKKILVTGGSSGIGRSIAILGSTLGASVTIVGRNEERLKETLSFMHGAVNYIVADLSTEKGIESVAEQSPKLDGVVHCAGIGHRRIGKQITPADVDEVMNINFKAPVLLQAALLSRKKVAPSASIVFIASKAATSPSIGNGLYSASKGALISYSKCLALELAPRKIRVNCVCPAMIWTELILQGTATKEDLLAEQQKYPLKRYGNPEDVANMVAYLLSDASSWLTNCCYDVTGGANEL